MENIVDEKIRNLARQSKLTVPDSYVNQVDQLLERLMADEKVIPIKRYLRTRKIAVVCIFCLLFGSAGVYAAVNYVTQRMQQMNQNEIADYEDGIQSSTENADSYSRKLSAAERKRLKVLTTQYQSEGVFPEGELLQVKWPEDIKSDRLCFVTATSTFYFPERDLTDEELLELIDFYYKRDYSIRQEEGEGTQTPTGEVGTEVFLSDTDAVERAVAVIKDIYDIDVSQMGYSIRSENPASDMYIYIIQFGEQSETTYSVILNSENGQITEVNMDNSGIYDQETVSDNAAYKNQYSLVKQMLQTNFLKEQPIEDGCFIYYENESDALLRNGVVTYFFTLSDGSGYVLNYSCSKKVVYGIRYLRDADSYEETNIANPEPDGQNGYSRTVIQME